MAKIEKTFNGKRFTYLCNGEVYKNSTRDYKYACVATTRKAKGAISEGREFILSLGNKVESTYNSMARFYKHCDLIGVLCLLYIHIRDIKVCITEMFNTAPHILSEW